MNTDQSKQTGQLLMGGSVIAVLLFIIGVSRRSYAALMLPVLLGVAAVSGLAFWVGYTMATTDWDDPADFDPDAAAADIEVPEAEGAPPPENVGR